MDAEVLIAGAGPVGLTAALELRRDVDVLVLDRLARPAPYAKAVGIQPRTVELWDSAGIARRALDAAVTLRGQIVYVNGAQVSRIDLHLPDTVPYRFAALPSTRRSACWPNHWQTWERTCNEASSSSTSRKTTHK